MPRELACCVAALVILALGPGAARELPPLTVHDVGEYGAIPWEDSRPPIKPGSRGDRVRDLNLAVSSVNINTEAPTSPATLERWAKAAHLGASLGMKFLPRVYFWDGADRYEGPMRDMDVYWQRLDRFLGAMDLMDFYGIVLAEENVHYAGRPEVLAELYRRIKAKYDVAVWQWWSPATAVPGSGGWIPADGWVIDNYFVAKEPFRRYLRKYLITGVPVVVMPAASTEWTFTPEQWQASNDQLDAAVEFNLPVAFYWVNKTTCYFDGDRSANETLMDRINQWVWRYVERTKALPPDYAGLSSADLAEGTVLELGPVEEDRFVYSDDFSTSRCVDEAWMKGFRDLVLTGSELRARGVGGRQTDVELEFRFAGELPVCYPEVRLEAQTDPALHGRVEVALSVDGETWPLAVASAEAGKRELRLPSVGEAIFGRVTAFRARIRMRGDAGTDGQPACRIDNLRVSGPMVAPERAVARLRPAGDGRLEYRDDFRTRKYSFSTTRSGDEKLEWSPGQLAVRLQPGGAAPALTWDVVADGPVKDVRVEVMGRANNGSLGTDHFLEVSADGETWIQAATTVGQKTDVNGWAGEPLVADLAGQRGYEAVTRFFVRLRMVAQGYEKLHPVPSGLVYGLRITASPVAP